MNDTELIEWIIKNRAQIWFEPGLGRGWTVETRNQPTGFRRSTYNDLRKAIEAEAEIEGEK